MDESVIEKWGPSDMKYSIFFMKDSSDKRDMSVYFNFFGGKERTDIAFRSHSWSKKKEIDMKKCNLFQGLLHIAVSAIMAVSLTPVFPSTAQAADHTISSALTSQYTIESGDTVTITPTGSITLENVRDTYQQALLCGDDTSVSNYGIIRASGNDGIPGHGFTVSGISSVSDSGFITNFGTISGTAESRGGYSDDDDFVSVSAYGISIFTNGYSPTITNSGIITASVEGVAFIPPASLLGPPISRLSSAGIYQNSIPSGFYTINRGAITSTTTVLSWSVPDDLLFGAVAYGIWGDELQGTILNDVSGTLTVSTDGSSAIVHQDSLEPYFGAMGISSSYVYSTGRIVNDGSISVSTLGQNFSNLGAYGINVYQLRGGSIINNGSIAASIGGYSGSALFNPSDAIVAGIDVSYMESGSSITNNGTIRSTLSPYLLNNYNNYGIHVSNMADGAHLRNTGTILATIHDEPTYYEGAWGIWLDTLNQHSTLINDGTITASIANSQSSNVGAYSLYIHENAATTVGGTVMNNGILSGNIYLGSISGNGAINLDNSGTLFIPALGNDGSGWVSGNYTQRAAGIFKVGVKSATEHGRLWVGGTTTLPGGAKVVVDVAQNNTLAAGNVLHIIRGNSSWSSTTYTITDNSSAWKFIPYYDAAEHFLNLTVAADTPLDPEDPPVDPEVPPVSRVSFADSAAQAGFSSGAGVAPVLDELYDNDSLNWIFGELFTALGDDDTPSEVADDLSKLLPLVSGGTSQVTFKTMRSASRIIQSRLESNKGLSFGDETPPDRMMWIKPFGSWADQDDTDGTTGYDARTYGVVFGADTDVSNSGYRLGVAFAYAASDVDSNSDVAPQSADINNYQLAFYGSYSLDKNIDLSFQADIGTSNYDGNRTISFDPSMHSIASSDYDSTNYHIGVGIERDIMLDKKMSFTPSARVDYTAIDSESYTETGAGAYNLNVDSQTVDELIFSVDGKITHKLNDVASLTGNIGLGLDAINDQGSITSSFVGGGSAFATSGIEPSALLVRGGLGLEMEPMNGLELVARYDLETRENFANHTVSIKIQMPF